jgi:hypothetical protein
MELSGCPSRKLSSDRVQLDFNNADFPGYTSDMIVELYIENIVPFAVFEFRA